MNTAIRSLSTFVATLGILLAATLSGRAQTDQLVVPSRWQGVAVGRVGATQFRLPVILELNAPQPGERNPFNLFVSVGNVATVGSCGLYSAMQTTTPYTLQSLTLQYLAIRANQTGFNAVLYNTQQSLASVANYFTGPNVTAMYSPMQSVRDMYAEIMGNRQDFYFKPGTRVTARLVRGRLVGSIQGTGSGIISAGIQPDLDYTATFALVRTR
ncbi:MAG TPA: hypothetical protein VFB21_01430 [Chthonomonadaceae bacterium]|nr:hypothetical protein [Chthonomonadaceae bacterium]